MTVRSMTGFARVDGGDDSASWYWEVRSVNGRGFDLRFRLPTGGERIEPRARELAGKRLARGSVNLQLLQRRSANATEIVVNEAALEQILKLADGLRERIGAAPPSVEGLLSLRGVLDAAEVVEDEAVREAREAAQLADLERALDGLNAARQDEGRRLEQIVNEQLERISKIVIAVEASPARTADAIARRLKSAVERLLDDRSISLDEARLHQEAVLLATKADVEEELQRLRAHIAAARDLLVAGASIGRRLDFLTQEFNREANTLCSKSNDTEITKLGLELKSVIDQMREQVQNIE